MCVHESSMSHLLKIDLKLGKKQEKTWGCLFFGGPLKNNWFPFQKKTRPSCLESPGGAESLPLIEIALILAIAAKERGWSPQYLL